MLSALAMVTSRIGLVATTTFAEKMDGVQLYKLFGHSVREYLQVGAFYQAPAYKSLEALFEIALDESRARRKSLV